MALYDRVKMTTATTGTGTITLGSAASGYRSFATAGVADGETVAYGIDDGSGWEVGTGTYTVAGTTLSRTPSASSNANAAINLSGSAVVFITARMVDFIATLAQTLTATQKAQALANIGTGRSLSQGRLTLTTAVPVTTSDVTGATTIYYTPYSGNTIWLYNGTLWVPVQFTEKSLSLSGFTTARLYDIFGYLSGSDLALEALIWTDSTTRATALARQDGCLVKSGTTTRLYLGTIYMSGTGTTEDSLAKRYVRNVPHVRVIKPMKVQEATASYTYSTAAWDYAQSDSTNRVEFVNALSEDTIDCWSRSRVINSTTTLRSVSAGIGVDAGATATVYGQLNATSAGAQTIECRHQYIGIGKHGLYRYEYGAGTDTQTWYGGTDTAGIFASIEV